MIDPISKAYQAIYQKKEEPKKEEKLPELYDGKYEEPDGNDKPSYYRDDAKKIEESTEPPKIEGLKFRELDDYDKGMYQAHIESKQHMSFEGTAYEHHDKAVHDLIKDGLTPEKYLAAKHILNNLPHDYSREYVRSVHPSELRVKYDYLDNYAASDDHEYKPEENYLSKDEIQKHLDSGYKFIRGRKIRHEATGIALQLHPDGSKTVTKALHDETPVDIPHDKLKPVYDHLADHFDEHIKNANADDGSSLRAHVHMYTSDSRELNTYLGHQYHGKTWVNDYRKYDDDTLEAHSNAMSKGIAEAPPLDKPVTVYTGVSHMTKLHTMTDGGTKHVRFVAPTFLSTSINPATATDFARMKQHPHSTDDLSNHDFTTDKEPNEFGKGEVADVLKMELPKGFKGGLYVDGYSTNRGEREMILDKHHTINVHPNPKYFVHDRKLTRMWHAEVEPKNYEE